MVRQVATEAEFDEVISGEGLTIVDFTATWCGPCQMIAPILEKLSEEHKDVTFIKVDVDELSELSSGRCGVTCMPTFHAYKGGKKVADFSGADQSKLRAL